jgi:putative ABC transport system permease protein
MSEKPWKPVAPLYRWLVGLASLITPRERRETWKREWVAEVEYRWLRYQSWQNLNRHARIELFKRCRGAFADAGWLQLRHLQQGVFQDLGHGARMLLKDHSFTTVAVITMALGIGVIVAVFSIANGALLRPLPYRDSERLMVVGHVSREPDAQPIPVSFPDYYSWRQEQQVFEDLAAYNTGSFALSGHGEPEWVAGAEISANLFPLLGTTPILGRGFSDEDDYLDADRVALVGYRLWQRRFGSNPDLIGRNLTLHGRSYRLVGVMPPQFEFPEHAEVWTLLARDPKRENHEEGGYFVIARLKHGIAIERAQEEMRSIARRGGHGKQMRADLKVGVVPMRDYYVRNARRAIFIFLGTGAFVLLIACANIAHLLLARTKTRQKEFSIRMALGASRARIVRQLLTESVLLALIGGLTGFLLGWWGKKTLLSSLPDLPFWTSFTLDLRIFGFTLIISLASGLIFGLAPALQTARFPLNKVPKGAGSPNMINARASRMSDLLAVSQIALALVLLIGAGLLVKGFSKLRQADPGFDLNQILTMRMTLPNIHYQQPEEQLAFFDHLVHRVRALPETQMAAAISELPLGGDRWDETYSPDAESSLFSERLPVAAHRVITPGYFKLMEIQLLRGREFDECDGLDRVHRVVIVNESLARRYWPGHDPLGKRLKYGRPDSPSPWLNIVGIVKDIKDEDLRREPRDILYIPHRQLPVSAMALVIRTSVDPLSLAQKVREEIRIIDPNLPVYQIRTMQQVMNRSFWDARFFSWLLGIMACIALVLALVGVYGVVRYSVAQRTQEIGIRLALGASPAVVMKLAIGRVMKVAAIGIAGGLVASLVFTPVLSLLLYDVSSTDPLVFAMTPSLLALAALLAAYLPARKAMKVDPVAALRAE